jgi:hypothetical protein
MLMQLSGNVVRIIDSFESDFVIQKAVLADDDGLCSAMPSGRATSILATRRSGRG